MSENTKKNNIIKPFKKSFNVNYLLITAVIFSLIILTGIFQFPSRVQKITISELIDEIKGNENKSKVYILSSGYIELQIEDKKLQAYYPESMKDFSELLEKEGIKISELQVYDIKQVFQISLDMIINIFLIIAAIIAVYFLARSLTSSSSKMTSFGQSTAKLLLGQKTDVKFDDVAGIDEAKEELQDIVDFLRYPKKYFELGARIPRGVLLIGSPGTGKTLLARAIAGEANVPFFHTSGSEFEEMLVGAGASRVRDLFKKARKLAPCIVFIDEIDAVAKKREVSLKSSYTEQTLNQILVEMDGFSRFDTVVVLAATNRPDILDPAILRPGRFDRKVVVEKPDMQGRIKIIKVHLRNKPIDPNVNLENIAKNTVGSSGADLENIVNEAAIIAAKAGKKIIIESDFDEAILKVLYGPKKMSREQTEKELLNTAYHEAGHAIVSYFTPNADPVHKISIISRGMSLGMTVILPEKDKTTITRNELLSKIRIYCAGRIAEELMMEDISTGASNDIEQATQIATKMIKEYGMSSKLGFVKYGNSVNELWLGYSYESSTNYSQEYASEIDKEIKEIVSTQYVKAKEILEKNKNKLLSLAKLLMSKEVVEKDEFENFMNKNE